MRKFLALTGSLLIFASVGFSQKFALKLGGGWGQASGGDFAKYIQGQSDYAHDAFTTNDRFVFPHLGMNFGGEFIFYFRPNMGLGLGFGYFRLAKDSEIAYDFGDVSATEQLKPNFMIIPLTLSFHYLWPLSSKLSLDLEAGISSFLVKLDWDYTTNFHLALPNDPSQVYEGVDQFIFQSGYRFGSGLQAGVSLEYRLFPRISLVIGGLGRISLLSASGFKGNWTEQGSGDLWNFLDSGSGTYVWYYAWKFNDKTYSQVVFQDEEPAAGATVSNVRRAKFGLTGFTATIGVKIGLGR